MLLLPITSTLVWSTSVTNEFQPGSNNIFHSDDLSNYSANINYLTLAPSMSLKHDLRSEVTPGRRRGSHRWKRQAMDLDAIGNGYADFMGGQNRYEYPSKCFWLLCYYSALSCKCLLLLFSYNQTICN